MADMATINATVDGTSYALRLLEADIAALLIEYAVPGDTLQTHLAMCRAAGINPYHGDPFALGEGRRFYSPFMLYLGITNTSDPTYRSPSGKALLALSASRMSNGSPSFDCVRMVLTLALKGGGMSMAAAGGVADNLAKSWQSAPGKSHYVGNVLAPQILAAAAAA